MSYIFSYAAVCDFCGAQIPMGYIGGSSMEIERDARTIPSTRLPADWCYWLRPNIIWSSQPYHAEFCCREHREQWIKNRFPGQQERLLRLVEQQDEQQRLEAEKVIAGWMVKEQAHD